MRMLKSFPLSESKDGLTSTSIVVGDGLFRVVKTTLHQDGVPRIDVQLVMDSELTSFQHTIDKPTPIEFGLTGGFAIAGLILMMVQGLTPIVLGLGLFLIGLKFLQRIWKGIGSSFLHVEIRMKSALEHGVFSPPGSVQVWP